jgi:group II intron reverse transcriptase/maturase
MASTQLKVRAFQRKLYLASKQKKDFRFYSLYDKVYRLDILMESYRQCRANGGSPGCDGITFSDIEEKGLLPWLQEISESLRERKYKPQAVKRVFIAKPGQPGKFRPLGIPTIRDRVVQGACKIVIEPIFEADLNESSYGYRPKRGAADAAKRIESSIKEGYRCVYDADIKGYFDHIPHDRLMAKIERRISDKSILALLRQFLRAPVLFTDENGMATITKPEMGTPQGGVISPLFANIYLNDFSNLITSKTPCRIISYADDFVILHRRPYTERQVQWFKAQLASEGLTINESKTRVVDMRKQKAEFDFLGFTFKMVASHWSKSGPYLRVQPSKKSQERFKAAIRDIVKHRTSLTLSELIAKVNPIVRGWRNYFNSCGYPKRVFFKMDWFIVARFYRWAKRLSQRRSKCLTPDPLKRLMQTGLELFRPPRLSPVKGA